MRPWLWWFVVFAGTMLIGAALRTFFTADSRTTSTTVLMAGELIVGLVTLFYALWRIINAGHAIPAEEKDESLRITE